MNSIYKKPLFWAAAMMCVATMSFATVPAQQAPAAPIVLPEGEGKPIIEKKCTVCHNASRIVSKRWPEELWEELLQEMLNEGAELTDEEFPIVFEYLSKNFKGDEN